MQNTRLSFARRSMLRDSGRMTALYFASCQIVNWCWTVGIGEGSIVAGLNTGSLTSGDKSFLCDTRNSDLGGGAEGGGSPIAG